MKPTNSASVLKELIRHHRIPVTKTTIEDELEKHPHNGNLYAMSDVLNSWKVPNQAFRIGFEALQKIPLPCIAHLKINRGEFVLIHHVTEEHICISKGSLRKKDLDVDAFKKVFSGEVLLLEKDGDAGEKDYRKKKKKELFKSLHYPALALGVFLVLIGALVNHGSFIDALSWQTSLLALFKTAGLATSILLLIHSIDANNPLIERLCGAEKKDCNVILSSKAAKITEFLNWSEAGFFYFSGSWLFLLFNNNIKEALTTLAFFNLLCLPYSFYSIYYQWQVAKQWCTFCIVIQVVFWLEFFAYIPTWYAFDASNFSAGVNLLIAFMLPVLGWYFIKPFLPETQKIEPLKKRLRKFTYKRKLFQKALLDQNRLDLPDEANTIVLGNVEAENTITIVSNPFCQPCSKAHKLFEQWLSEIDAFKLQIVFTTENNEKENKTRVAGHLHQLYADNKEQAYEAIHNWYEGKYKKVEELMDAYPVKNTIFFSEQLEMQKEWCRLAEVVSTPTVFLNGYRIPLPWQYQDIKYFLY
jgi:uncharacterized membrane protein